VITKQSFPELNCPLRVQRDVGAPCARFLSAPRLPLGRPPPTFARCHLPPAGSASLRTTYSTSDASQNLDLGPTFPRKIKTTASTDSFSPIRCCCSHPKLFFLVFLVHRPADTGHDATLSSHNTYPGKVPRRVAEDAAHRTTKPVQLLNNQYYSCA
jgi:hypothetical protein